MKFLIQKINHEIRHDFAFTLIESARFYNWLNHDTRVGIKYLNTIDIVEPSDIYPPFDFKNYHYRQQYVPIGSVDFVVEYLQRMYGLNPKPINVPEELFHYAGREIFNGNHMSLKNLGGEYFVKTNDYIKGFAEIINCKTVGNNFPSIPEGSYQISQKINIDSEWRAFVYDGKLVGLQNYSGEFTKWPDVWIIKAMIERYKSAPIAYTLDVGINEDSGTFVIECHLLMSTGLYGFSDHKVLPYMFYKCFHEFVQREGKYE
jgi:hypothetical protein